MSGGDSQGCHTAFQGSDPLLVLKREAESA